MTTRRLLAASAIIQLLISGCTSGGLGNPFARKESTKPDREPIASRVTSTPMNTNEAEPTTQPTDAMTAQVQTFIAKFPPDDRDRETKLYPSRTPAPKPAPPTIVASTQPAVSPNPVTPPAHPAPAPAPVPAVAVTNTPAPAPGIPAPTPAPAPAISTPPASSTPSPTAMAMMPVQARISRPTTAPASNVDVQASPAPMGPPPPLPAAIRQPRVELIDVRAAAPTTAPAEYTTVETLPPANQPVMKAPAPRSADLGTVVTDLEASVGSHPEHLDDLLKLRLLYLATGQDEKAAGPVAVPDPVQAEMVSALFQVMRTSKSAVRQPTSSPAPALLAVDELRRLLAQQTPVMIPKVALVTSVNSFGDYEAVNPPKFPAGAVVEVFLYTEVANFRSEPTPDGRLRTLLSEKVEIFDANGKVVWQQSVGEIEDKVLTPRHDFFIPLKITLPATTPAGQYVLKVSIEDKIGATTDQQRMTFTVGQ